ncbi:MAG: fumarylacetoacetate hydrolase family protein [Pseudolabrys sp.]|nr:fumarylacetoacetate hydrolase family protein [Pseudolabrys sp.]
MNAPAHNFPAVEETVVPVTGGGSYPVRRIYCVGRNYVSHIREMKEADERDPPFFFQKPRDSIVGDGAEVPYPPMTADFQYEVELVVAIGKGGRNIDPANGLDHVWGYAVGIDLTRRDRQRDARDLQLPWEVGKSFDRSAPCGALHPAASVGHLASGAITLSVNGQEHQRGDLREMIWNVPEIVAQLSKQVTLATGDLIFTGTPAGVGPVVAGDRIEATVEGLAPLTITIGPPEK